MKKVTLLLSFVSLSFSAQTFTKQDTLKGSDTEYRNFWDVKKYDINLEANFENRSIAGTNKISFVITKDVVNPTFQIDLQKPMKVAKLVASFDKKPKYQQE
ncbi:MAG: M1 family peptidase, partial [Soonwooa sp.]